MNCFLLGMEDFSGNLTECADESSAKKTYRAFSSYTSGHLRQVWLDKCPVPCVRKNYAYTKKNLHSNSWLNPGANRVDGISVCSQVISYSF